MDNIEMKGYTQFMQQYFDKNKDLFSNLSNHQKPHTMIITCSDSRIDPSLILNAQPGELFIARNIGNVVPPYQPSKGSTQAAIEYAVNALDVEKIVVLGHSNCGACAHVYHEAKENETELVHVEEWLKYITPAKSAAMLEVHADHSKNIFELTEKHNIMTSLQRLLEYPYVQSRLINEKIEIEGWWFDIKTGVVETYNFNTRHFDPVMCDMVYSEQKSKASDDSLASLTRTLHYEHA